jgi:hypothetical protein
MHLQPAPVSQSFIASYLKLALVARVKKRGRGNKSARERGKIRVREYGKVTKGRIKEEKVSRIEMMKVNKTNIGTKKRGGKPAKISIIFCHLHISIVQETIASCLCLKGKRRSCGEQAIVLLILFLVWFLFQLGDLSNPELRILTDQLDKIRYGGE